MKTPAPQDDPEVPQEGGSNILYLSREELLRLYIRLTLLQIMINLALG